MAELAWQGLSKDGSKGGAGRPHVVGWDGDPERAMLTLGGWLSSLGAGVIPDFRVSRRLDLGWQEIPRGPQTLMNRSGMLTSLPNEDKYTKAHSRNGRVEAGAPAGGPARGPQLLLGTREAESLRAGLGLGKEGREESTRACRMEKWAPRETLREL